jgi:uncharacterized protein (DUF2235 family)
MGAPGAWNAASQWITKVLGLAFGYGLTDRVGDAYRHLMETYEEGDAVFLFGFSRGAYTVRALGGLLHMFGLVREGNESLIPYVTAMFSRHDTKVFALAREFKATFSRECPIAFVGVWDTVSSVGWIYEPVKLPYTASNASMKVGRQAVSIDERRCFFRQNLWIPAYAGQDIKQVWFAGVHSDIGGGYDNRESGLANITLQWIVDEARQHGLLIDQTKAGELFSTPEGRPDAAGTLHKSLDGPWWILELCPKRYIDASESPPTARWRIPLGGCRRIPDDSTVHGSVIQRLRLGSAHYRPPNLPSRYGIEGG